MIKELILFRANLVEQLLDLTNKNISCVGTYREYLLQYVKFITCIIHTCKENEYKNII